MTFNWGRLLSMRDSNTNNALVHTARANCTLLAVCHALITNYATWTCKTMCTPCRMPLSSWIIIKLCAIYYVSARSFEILQVYRLHLRTRRHGGGPLACRNEYEFGRSRHCLGFLLLYWRYVLCNPVNIVVRRWNKNHHLSFSTSWHVSVSGVELKKWFSMLH